MKLSAIGSALVIVLALCSQQAQAYIKYQVTASAVKIRTKPSTASDSKVVGQYNHCEVVDLVEYSGVADGYRWVKVHWRGGNYYSAIGPLSNESWMQTYPAPGC